MEPDPLSPLAPPSGSLGVGTVQLGDIIRLQAPKNQELHQQTFYVFYADERKLKLLNTSTKEVHELRIDGYVADESIESAELLSRSKVPGFARQHKLEPPAWVNVHFGGDMPAVITGEITNLEEDMIEITVYPSLRVVYIDFAYRGIPDDLPIEKIVLRDRPAALNTSLRDLASSGSGVDSGSNVTSLDELQLASHQMQSYIDETDGQYVVEVPDRLIMNPSEDEVIAEFVDRSVESWRSAPASADANEPLLADDGAAATAAAASFDEQAADLLVRLLKEVDELEGGRPPPRTEGRDPRVMRDIHRLITRFGELRKAYSVFDSNERVLFPKTTNVLRKPLVDRLMQGDPTYPWCMPCVRRDTPAAASPGPGPDDDLFAWLQGEQRQPLPPDDHVGSVAHEVFVETSAEKNAVSLKTSHLSIERSVDPSVSPPAWVWLPRFVWRQARASLPGTPIYEKSLLSQIPLYRNQYMRPFTRIPRRVLKDVSQEIPYASPLAKILSDSKIPENTRNAAEFLERAVMFQYTDEPFPGSPSTQGPEAYRDFLQAAVPSTQALLEWIQVHHSHPLFSLSDVAQALESFSVDESDLSHPHLVTVRSFLKERIRKYRAALDARRKTLQLVRSLPSAVGAAAAASARNRIEELLQEQPLFLEHVTHKYRVKRRDPATAPPPTASNAMGPAAIAEGGAPLDAAAPPKKHSMHGWTTSEVLQHMLAADGAKDLAAVMHLQVLRQLTVPESALQFVKPPVITPTSEDDQQYKLLAKSECDRRTLAKRYKNLADLQKDNYDEDLFFDKEFDDTPYFLLDHYRAERKRFKDDNVFLEFFAETLIQKHDCPPSMARTLAATILSKKKRVREGEYAVLEIKPTLSDKLHRADDDSDDRHPAPPAPRETVEYYRRTHHKWMLDKTAAPHHFVDTNTLFCELSADCTQLSQVNKCVSQDLAALQMQMSRRARIMEEFESRVSKTFEQEADELVASLNGHAAHLSNGLLLQRAETQRQSVYSYELGNLAAVVPSAKENVFAESPHVALRQEVLGERDALTRHQRICQFVDRCCREPTPHLQENVHWLYCVDTNTALFPQSLFRLAQAFCVSPATYRAVLTELVRTLGALSDDGAAWVDKHTGYVLQPVPAARPSLPSLASGSPLVFGSPAVFGSPLVFGSPAVFSQAFAEVHKHRIFQDPLSQVVFNVFYTLSDAMGISKEFVDSGIEEDVLRMTLSAMTNPDIVQPESVYLAEQAAKHPDAATTGGEVALPRRPPAPDTKGEQGRKSGASATGGKKVAIVKPTKRGTPYKTYYNRMLVLMVACTLLISLQTAVPAFTARKTFPGCIKSFGGYPLDPSTTNTSGLKYIACVLSRSHQSAVAPWNAVARASTESLVRRMQQLLHDHLCLRPDVQQKYERKWALDKKKGRAAATPAPTQRDVAPSFLPPLFPAPYVSGNVPGAVPATGITEDTEKELHEAMLQGAKTQFVLLNAIAGKITRGGYGVLDVIDRVVRKKQLLLTSYTGVLFLENACCDRDGGGEASDTRRSLTPLEYVQRESPELTPLLRKIATMEAVVGRAAAVTAPSVWSAPPVVRAQAAPMDGAFPDALLSSVIYETVMHYGNFNRDRPVPLAYRSVVAMDGQKPDYDRTTSLTEKIDFMRRHGHSYGPEEFHRLMRVVNDRNRVRMGGVDGDEGAANRSSVVGLYDILNHLEETDSHVVGGVLRSLLRKALDEYDPRSAVHEPTEAQRKLGAYLQATNHQLRQKILDFVDAFGTCTDSQLEQMEAFLDGWAREGASPTSSSSLPFEDTAARIHQLRNVAYHWSKWFPSLLQNSHSHAHRGEPNRLLYRPFRALAVDNGRNRAFSQLLDTVRPVLRDVLLFVEEVPRLAPMVHAGVAHWPLFHDTLVLQLHAYALLSMLYEYVAAADNPEFVQLRAEELQRNQLHQQVDNIESGWIGGRSVRHTDSDLDYGVSAPQIREVHIVDADNHDAKQWVAEVVALFIRFEMRTDALVEPHYRQLLASTRTVKELKKHVVQGDLASPFAAPTAEHQDVDSDSDEEEDNPDNGADDALDYSYD